MVYWHDMVKQLLPGAIFAAQWLPKQCKLQLTHQKEERRWLVLARHTRHDHHGVYAPWHAPFLV
jgi:hypothetical protein